MRSYWAEFAYSGDPGTGRDGQLPRWSAWDDSTAASDKFIVLDTSADGGLRMSSDRVTREGLVADISSDSRMSKRDKCGLYRQFAVWYEWLDEAEYATAGAVGCGDLPLADYPWENLPSVASAATTE